MQGGAVQGGPLNAAQGAGNNYPLRGGKHTAFEGEPPRMRARTQQLCTVHIHPQSAIDNTAYQRSINIVGGVRVIAFVAGGYQQLDAVRGSINYANIAVADWCDNSDLSLSLSASGQQWHPVLSCS